MKKEIPLAKVLHGELLANVTVILVCKAFHFQQYLKKNYNKDLYTTYKDIICDNYKRKRGNEAV